MWRHVIGFALASSLIVSDAKAESIWIGPQVGLPVPGQDVGDFQSGIDVGVTLDQTSELSFVFVGFDVVHHQWPASPTYKAAFDRYLRYQWYERIDSSNWAFSALQLTTHLKFSAPLTARHRPWVQAGIGAYRLHRNLAPTDWDGSVAIVVGASLGNVTFVPGWNVGFGYDQSLGPRMAWGVQATYHRVGSEHEDIPDFSALTIGTHLLFGR